MAVRSGRIVQELRPAMAAAASPLLMITVRREIGSESVVRSLGFMDARSGSGKLVMIMQSRTTGSS